MNLRNLTLEQAAAICYPERLDESQIDRLQAINDKRTADSVENWQRQNAHFWKEMVCRLLVPTPITHEEVIKIMERVTK